MAKVGRPRTRSLEPVLMQIYGLVKNDLVNYQHVRRAVSIKNDLVDWMTKEGVSLQGEKNISRACDRIMLKQKKITFIIRPDGSQRIDILNGRALRKYFNEAVRCRNDLMGYPHLAQYADHIDECIDLEKKKSDRLLKRSRGRPKLIVEGQTKKRTRTKTQYPASWTGLI